MPAVHLVPAEDGADFPYDDTAKEILGMAGVEKSEVDFDTLINKAIDNQWPNEVVKNYEKQRASGKCFEFKQSSEPFLEGTMFPDNVRINFKDEAHQESCEKTVLELTKKHGLKMSIV